MDNSQTKILRLADDTKIYGIVNNQHGRQEIQKAIDKLLDWMEENRLQFNAQKTYHVSYLPNRIIRIEST